MNNIPQATCPRCGRSFICRADDIMHCTCREVVLTVSERDWLMQQYGSRCVCGDCLQEIVAARISGDGMLSASGKKD
ncbi:cysteine-rich CWC family protein [Chitinophaga vietnamensis]|uniref:cysteine-rich CWC family protein n=1 Tax=Chitinophaga vietnamensis TaxID=2593957 RepID=UPI00117740FE